MCNHNFISIGKLPKEVNKKVVERIGTCDYNNYFICIECMNIFWSRIYLDGWKKEKSFSDINAIPSIKTYLLCKLFNENNL